jgi:hypothetical protein
MRLEKGPHSLEMSVVSHVIDFAFHVSNEVTAQEVEEDIGQLKAGVLPLMLVTYVMMHQSSGSACFLIFIYSLKV